MNGKLQTFFRHDSNPFFGSPVTNKTSKASTTYGELTAKFGLTFENSYGWMDLETKIEGVFLSTIGQDFNGIANDENEIGFDEAFVQFKNIHHLPIDMKVGRQRIMIEKSFLYADAVPEDAAVWISAVKSFPMAVRMDARIGDLTLTPFWADVERYHKQGDQGDVGLRGKRGVQTAGVNFHYDLNESSFIFGGFYRKIDDSNLSIAGFSPNGQTRLSDNDTNAWDLGFDVKWRSLRLAGELVYQNGNAGQLGGKRLDRNAWGGYAIAQYFFDAPKSPFLRFYYVYFGGDSDLEDDEEESFDPFFSTSSIWNEWLIGELVGEAQLANTNKTAFIAEIGMSPMKKMNVHLLYIKHALAEKYLGISRGRQALGTTNWADEFNLFVEYEFNENVWGHLGNGLIFPNGGAKEFYGNDNSTFFSQLWMVFKF